MCVATMQLDMFLKPLITKPACAQKINDTNLHSKCTHVETLVFCHVHDGMHKQHVCASLFELIHFRLQEHVFFYTFCVFHWHALWLHIRPNKVKNTHVSGPPAWSIFSDPFSGFYHYYQ